MTGVTRREFLKRGAAGAGALYVSSLGFDVSVAKATTIKQGLRIEGATVSHSVCPYCAVGCSILAYTRKTSDGKVELLQIEGDPDSPVNEGTPLPEGGEHDGARRLAPASGRPALPGSRRGRVAARSPGTPRSTSLLALIKDARDETFVTKDENGNVVNRCEGIAFAGGAAFSSEEGYFAAKLMRALGVVT